MTRDFSLQQVVCRPARERDLDEIKEFCKTIWDGHDYIQYVIEDWYRDPTGLFAVAEHEGHAIACSKVTRLTEGQWWLEGFRVNPDFQGHKVGSLIHHYLCDWWERHSSGVLRLMTNSKNKAVHHLCEQSGFTRLFEVRGYTAEPLDGDPAMFAPAGDLQQALSFARAAASLALTNCIVDFGWRLVDPTSAQALADLSALHTDMGERVFWWRADQGVLVTWEDNDPNDGERTLGIGVIASELEKLSAFLQDVRRLAAAREMSSVFWIAPAHEQVEAALRPAGYASSWDGTAYVYEKRSPQPL